MNFSDDIKNPFRSGNTVSQLIILSVIVFLVQNLIILFFMLSGYKSNELKILAAEFFSYITLPLNPEEFLHKPWTLLSSIFVHSGIGHIFWNMLILYFFGRIFSEFNSSKRVFSVFFPGAVLGGLLCIAGVNLIPALNDGKIVTGYAMGASAGVNAIVLAAATLVPELRLNLILIGPVKLKYIALFYLVMDVMGVASLDNSGGHIAHLGGALYGYLFIILQKKGTDLSVPYNRIFGLGFLKRGKRERKVKMKVTKGGRSVSDEDYNFSKAQKQKKVDEILDKINRSGYESLSKSEKEFLFNHGKDV